MKKYKTTQESLNRIKERLRLQRKCLKLTQAELAQKINIGNGDSSSRTTLTTWEKKDNSILPGLVPFMDLCNALNVDADYLLGASHVVSTDTNTMSQTLHLSEGIVNLLQNHTEYGSVIDALVSSESMNQITAQIKKLVNMELMKDVITNSFTPAFSSTLDKWFEDYFSNIFPMDMSPITYRKYLETRIPFHTSFCAENFLDDNFLEDGKLFVENLNSDFYRLSPREHYQLILEAIVDISFDYKVGCALMDLSRKRLSDILFDAINHYVEQEALRIHDKIRAHIERAL